MAKKTKADRAAGKRHVHKKHRQHTVPRELVPDADAPVIKTAFGSFDLEDPELPSWLDKAALASGGYPYSDTMERKEYAAELEALQVELVKLQRHANNTGLRILSLFEGRDAAGKGGVIFDIRQYMNPRTARIVALPKPTDAERGQWYFQRYVAQLPTAGEITLFDRSWYNRGGVEPVMKFCTTQEASDFLIQAPAFETMLVNAGIVLLKFWMEIGREMQLKQFHQRRHDPLKIWKLSPIDYIAMEKWDDYTRARNRTLAATDQRDAPWTVVLSNDKRRARLAVIRHLLGVCDYRGKDAKLVGKPDPLILGTPQLLKAPARAGSKR